MVKVAKFEVWTTRSLCGTIGDNEKSSCSLTFTAVILQIVASEIALSGDKIKLCSWSMVSFFNILLDGTSYLCASDTYLDNYIRTYFWWRNVEIWISGNRFDDFYWNASAQHKRDYVLSSIHKTTYVNTLWWNHRIASSLDCIEFYLDLVATDCTPPMLSII